jgi:hypothetical protein
MWCATGGGADVETGVGPSLSSSSTDVQDKRLFIEQKVGMNGAPENGKRCGIVP